VLGAKGVLTARRGALERPLFVMYTSNVRLNLAGSAGAGLTARPGVSELSELEEHLVDMIDENTVPAGSEVTLRRRALVRLEALVLFGVLVEIAWCTQHCW
jgi:hypothetical protein